MTVYIILALVTVLLATLVRSEYEESKMGIDSISKEHLRSNVAAVFIFILLFIVSAARFHVGNDYTRYEEFFHLIPLKQVVPTEFGFNWIVLFLQWIFGIDTKLTIFAFFGFITIFFCILAIKEQSENFLYSFFLFMMMGYYYQSLNTVRYYMAWAIALWSMKFVRQRRYWRFLIAVLITATIHKSVLIVLLFFLIANYRWKKWQYALLTLLAASGFVLGDLYLKIIMRLYPSYEGTSYLDGGTSVINLIKVAAVLILTYIVYFMNKEKSVFEDTDTGFYFRLNFLALLLYAGGSFIPEISRIGYYLTGCQIFFIPMLIARIEDRRIKKIVNYIVIIAAIIYFACMLIRGREHLIRIVPYHTWMLPGNIVD